MEKTQISVLRLVLYRNFLWQLYGRRARQIISIVASSSAIIYYYKYNQTFTKRIVGYLKQKRVVIIVPFEGIARFVTKRLKTIVGCCV